MISIQLPIIFQNKYEKLKPFISQRLDDFKNVQESKYFYELCFCICTPQSRASSAMAVQLELEKLEFLNNDFDPTPLLRNKDNYIRFHNQKSKRLVLIDSQAITAPYYHFDGDYYQLLSRNKKGIPALQSLLKKFKLEPFKTDPRNKNIFFKKIYFIYFILNI